MVGNFITELFYVICSDLNQLIKNSCFVVSSLVALSHLRKDDKYIKMERAPRKPVDDLYDIEEIRNVYQKCGIPPGVVKTKVSIWWYILINIRIVLFMIHVLMKTGI